MTDKPTITVDLETLANVLTDADFPSYPPKSHDDLSKAVAERRKELNAPAPGPWQRTKHSRAHADISSFLVDANSIQLTVRDLDRAAMSPELAKAVRSMLREIKHNDWHFTTGETVKELLARFDKPGTTDE